MALKMFEIGTYVYKLFPDMRFIVGIRVVSVHVFDGTKNTFWIERVIILHYVISDHNIKEWPSNVIIGR